MSRRKTPAEKSRAKSNADNEQEEAREKRSSREKDADRETPSKAGGKLTRNGRPRGVQPPTQHAPPPKSGREEEPCLNKKTPKRLSKSKSWLSTINSPSNDLEQQHEIFWDPHSPTPFKIENGKRRHAANKCADDISDIVNRIAPKTEKSANADAAYLGMWIGEDAIPSTPVVARARTKIARSKIIHTEEELMKLAKQFDRNLVETVHHEQNGHVDQPDEKISDKEPALDIIPEEDIALHSVSQHSDVGVYSQKGSQKSVDLDTEAEVNALFDSSTQKFSGQLSQSLSDISTSSICRQSVRTEANPTENPPVKNQRQLCEKPTSSKQTLLDKLNSDVFRTPVKNNSHVRKDPTMSNEPPPSSSVTLSQDDFEDEWGTDFFEDDSFVMQITQNPSLIATPTQDSTASIPCHADKGFLETKLAKHVKTSVKREDISAESNKPNSYKFVSRTIKECGKGTELTCTGKSKNVNMMPKADDHSNGRCTVKPASSTVTRIPLQSHINSELPSNNNPASGTGFVSETFQNKSKTTISTAQASTSEQIDLSVKMCPQTVPPKQASTSKGSDDWEWEDPKFSDEMLDMFCESDSLWEANKEDDDDNLLYQMCDDVERSTQTQMVEEPDKIKNKHFSSSISKNSSNPRDRTTDGEQIKESKHRTCIVISNASSNITNRFNASTVSSNMSTKSVLAASSTYGTSEKNTNDNSRSTEHAPSPLARSISVPLGGQCDYQKAIPKDTVSQNVKNSLAASKYTFTRIRPSQVSVFSTSTNTDKLSSAKDTVCGVSGNSTQRSSILKGSVHSPQQPSLKRHLSESVLQSTKVFVAEDGNKKCSMEEIARKKQEALARRQMKARGLSYDSTRT